MKTIKVLKYVSLVCFLALAVVLIVEASMPGEVSSSHSGSVSNAIQQTTEKVEDAVGGSREVSNSMLSNWSKFSYYVRKGIGHFGAFAILGVVGTCAFLFIASDKMGGAAVSLALGISLALATELIQLHVPGRFGSADDVTLDFIGYVVGFAAVIIIVLISRIISIQRYKNKAKIKNPI